MTGLSLYDYVLKINNVMARIQSELKCGICRSTFSNPVSATCGHVFCKGCLDVVFQRRRAVECPLCRQEMNKRSCTASEQHNAIVKGYLQLGRNFLRDSQEQTISAPKDIAYIESQVPMTTHVSDSPMRDFRPTPQFALPKARARRKQPLKIGSDSKLLKLEKIAEEPECTENKSTSQPDQVTQREEVRRKTSILPRRPETATVLFSRSSTVEVQCNLPDPTCICGSLRQSLATFRARNSSTQFPSDIHALLAMTPEMNELLTENVSAVCELLNLQPIAAAATPIVMTEEIHEHCASDAITIDDFSIDDPDADMEDTQPPVLKNETATCAAEKEIVFGDFFPSPENMDRVRQEAIDRGDVRPASSCTRSSSDIVPQSSPDSEANGVEEDDCLDITIHVPFDSPSEQNDLCPAVDTKENQDAAHSPIILSVSRLSCIEDEHLVSEFLETFPHVRYEQDITPSSTHVVMMNSSGRSCRRRSLRYVFAIARRCELLDRSWLQNSTKARNLQPTASYALIDESGWVRARKSTEQLFDGMKFFLPVEFSNSRLLPLDKLKELITICGGKCLDKPWNIASPQNAFTIFMPHSTDFDAARRYEASMDGVPVLTADWVLDSVAEFRVLPLEPYRVRQKHSFG